MNLERLHSAVAAVCPIYGVSIGDANNKATWSVSFKLDATTEQREAAQAIIDAADVSILNDVTYVSVRVIVARLTAISKAETVWTALTTAQQLNFLTLERGIDINDSTVRTLLASLDIDPDSILY